MKRIALLATLVAAIVISDGASARGGGGFRGGGLRSSGVSHGGPGWSGFSAGQGRFALAVRAGVSRPALSHGGVRHARIGHGIRHGHIGHSIRHGHIGHGVRHGHIGHGVRHGHIGHGVRHARIGHGVRHARIGHGVAGHGHRAVVHGRFAAVSRAVRWHHHPGRGWRRFDGGFGSGSGAGYAAVALPEDPGLDGFGEPPLAFGPGGPVLDDGIAAVTTRTGVAYATEDAPGSIRRSHELDHPRPYFPRRRGHPDSRK
jgi:hypothetical protein